MLSCCASKHLSMHAEKGPSQRVCRMRGPPWEPPEFREPHMAKVAVSRNLWNPDPEPETLHPKPLSTKSPAARSKPQP